MPRYMSSDGYLDKKYIDAQVKLAKIKATERCIEEHGYSVCERCLNNSCQPLDRSHIVSVKYAQEIGRSEIAFDPDDIEVLGRPHHLEIEDWPNLKRLAYYEARKQGLTYQEFIEGYEY